MEGLNEDTLLGTYGFRSRFALDGREYSVGKHVAPVGKRITLCATAEEVRLRYARGKEVAFVFVDADDVQQEKDGFSVSHLTVAYHFFLET